MVRSIQSPQEPSRTTASRDHEHPNGASDLAGLESGDRKPNGTVSISSDVSTQPDLVWNEGVSPQTNETFGEYDLISEIARGGMGVVFKARQRALNRTVAPTMIFSDRLDGEEEIVRFRAEAAAAARLNHPGIVPIYEVGARGGHHFFSMG